MRRKLKMNQKALEKKGNGCHVSAGDDGILEAAMLRRPRALASEKMYVSIQGVHSKQRLHSFCDMILSTKTPEHDAWTSTIVVHMRTKIIDDAATHCVQESYKLLQKTRSARLSFTLTYLGPVFSSRQFKRRSTAPFEMPPIPALVARVRLLAGLPPQGLSSGRPRPSRLRLLPQRLLLH
jgi:hypothetical protein